MATGLRQGWPSPPPGSRTGGGREKVLPTLVGILRALEAIEAAIDVIDARLTALESRPAGQVRLVEFRPDHRRHADGGEPVRAQRRRARDQALELEAEQSLLADRGEEDILAADAWARARP